MIVLHGKWDREMGMHGTKVLNTEPVILCDEGCYALYVFFGKGGSVFRLKVFTIPFLSHCCHFPLLRYRQRKMETDREVVAVGKHV